MEKDKMRSTVMCISAKYSIVGQEEVVFGEIVQRIVPGMPIIYIVLGWEMTYYTIWKIHV
jgi:hypothetical protein